MTDDVVSPFFALELRARKHIDEVINVSLNAFFTDMLTFFHLF